MSISSDASSGNGAGAGVLPERTRSSYQMEILQESLKRNIIITMDKPSERTHIAVLRIRAQLEKGDDKLCWLLIPDVPLGYKQYKTLETLLPPVNIQFLSSDSNVGNWKSQATWNKILALGKNASTIVVSTHQVLLDALTHGLVRIQKIGLLVFNEAHNYVANNPDNRIIEGLFWLSHEGKDLPAVLGLAGTSVANTEPQFSSASGLSFDAIPRTASPNCEGLEQVQVLGDGIYSCQGLEYKVAGLETFIDTNTSIVEETERKLTGAFEAVDIDTADPLDRSTKTMNATDHTGNLGKYENINPEEAQTPISLYIVPTTKFDLRPVPVASGRGRDRETDTDQWGKLESESTEGYVDEMVGLEETLEREDNNVDEHEALNENKSRSILVESTGAVLNLESAIPALEHFCASLPQGVYTDLRPIFTTSIDSSAQSLYRAEVILPNCIPIPLKVRRTASKRAWRTKTWAKRDAAFEAYLSLYQLKEDPLLNNHLLPLWTYPASSLALRYAKKKRAQAVVDKTMDPWAGMKWKEETIIYATPITLTMPDANGPVEIDMLTPVECPPVDSIVVYWTKATNYKVIVGESRCLGADHTLVINARKMTYRLLHTVFGSKMSDSVMDFPYLFIPREQDQSWTVGVPMNALQAYIKYGPDKSIGILQDTTYHGPKYFIHRWRTDISPLDQPEITSKYGSRPIDPDQPLLEAIRFPERRDFLHEVSGEAAQETTVFLLPEYCTVGNIPWYYLKFALVLPGVIRRIEIAFIASDLQRTLLAPVGIKSTSKVITALCAPSAREPTDYQRFEFLGDVVLKFLTSVNLLDEHPFWHEGYLSSKKARTIANYHLAKVAEDKGLAKWIITDIFTGLKWKPRYVTPNDILTENTPTANKVLSIKILADVVEALIGAAYLEGGYQKALKCIATFGPGITWKPLGTRIDSLFTNAASSPTVCISYLQDLEKLLGYKFKHQTLLLEAITHPSCESTPLSYGRLQFLGDSLLDMVVVPEVFFDPTLLSPVNMHLFKSSVVAGNFLAFLSLGYSITLGYPATQPLEDGTTAFEVVTKEREVNLWQFVDFSHPEMENSRKTLGNQYEGGLRDKVQKALDSGMYYPWAELSVFEADKKGKNKFFPDIFEAIIAAVFVDSGGDSGIVKALAGRFGILKWLRRFVKDKVNVTHPVTRLEEMVAPMHKGQPKYVIGIESGDHVCTILFDNQELAVARSGSKSEARAAAAEVGLKELEKLVVKAG